MIVPGLRTPRMTAHRWVASITTPTPWGAAALEEFGDLLGQPLLDLEPPGIHLDDARDLRQPDDAAARDVGDGRGAEERQQVVLAQRVERDVLDDDHLAVADVEDRVVDEPLGIDVVAGGELRVHPVDTLRGAQRPSRSGSSPISSRISRTADSTRPFGSTSWGRPAVARLEPPSAVGFDDRRGAARFLADLGLDLVDDALDVTREFGRAGQRGGSRCRRRWYRREGRIAGAIRVGRGGSGSRARTGVPPRNDMAATRRRAGPSRSHPADEAGVFTSATAVARAMSPAGHTSGRPSTIRR